MSTSPPHTALIASPQVLWPDGTLRPGWVLVESGRIAGTGHGEPPRRPDLSSPYLAPGFVDVHCHGGGGYSFATTDRQEAAVVVATHLRRGTTTIVASLVTAPLDELEAQVRMLASLAEEGVIAGIHLEGPWLSPSQRGAHDPDLLLEPRIEDLDRLLRAGQGHVKMVTIAPELPGALELIRHLVQHGVVAALGHTDADDVQFRTGVAAGARMVTHVCNAMRPIHHRDPGPVVAALADPQLHVELIADGTHVHPAVVDLIWRGTRAGIVLVTDAMAGAAAPDGRYRLGATEVDVADGVAKVAGTDDLAGSTLTMDRAVATAARCNVHPAWVLTAATAAPAQALGLSAGRIEEGAPGHLVTLDEQLVVERVLVL